MSMLFAGFFIITSNMPSYLAWLQYLSWIHYAFMSLVQLEFNECVNLHLSVKTIYMIRFELLFICSTSTLSLYEICSLELKCDSDQLLRVGNSTVCPITNGEDVSSHVNVCLCYCTAGQTPLTQYTATIVSP